MNGRFVTNVLGKVLCIEGALMLLPLLCALICRERALPFLIPILLIAAAGAALWRFKPAAGDASAGEGLFCAGASWVLMSLFGALPFVLSGDIPRFVDAVFESVSGFTTTGASILPAVEGMSRGCMFWRLFIHWVGGMGVLVFVMAVLPTSGKYMHVMRAEVPGPVVGKLMPRIRATARILYGIYIALTALETVLLLFGGMSFYEAVLHAFATAGTGGFSTRNASVGAFDSVYIETVIATFMLLFGVNFNAFYLLLLGRFRSVWKSEELRAYLAVIAAAVLVIAGNIASRVGGFGQGLRYAYFQVTSVMSTTGFSTADYDLWPELSRWILFLLMFVGGCAGSTAGGMKLTRVVILAKAAANDLKRQIFPTRVKRVWFESRPVDVTTVNGIHAFSAAYIALFLLAGLVLSLDGFDFTATLTASLACLSNVGPGFSIVGPAGNYAAFSALSKVVLILEMLLGRLEIFPILFLFTPGAWSFRKKS